MSSRQPFRSSPFPEWVGKTRFATTCLFTIASSKEKYRQTERAATGIYIQLTSQDSAKEISANALPGKTVCRTNVKLFHESASTDPTHCPTRLEELTPDLSFHTLVRVTLFLKYFNPLSIQILLQFLV